MSEDAKLEGNSNKNIWLAVALAVITSLTSLGTAFISKDNDSKCCEDLTKRVEALETKNKELTDIVDETRQIVFLKGEKKK
jgi:hypothetical protein